MTVLFAEKSSTELDDLLDGRYRISQVLSTNPWGQSWLAQDIRRPSQPQCMIQQIKAIATEPGYEEVVRHLFVREATILERLSEHDQIPQLLACFAAEQSFYLVQEYVNGYPLSLQLHPEQPWHPEAVGHLLLECLEPLAFVHSQGIWHGNLKPDNLLRRTRDERLVLVNFDSAKQMYLSLLALHGEDAIAKVNQEGYQAPEQVAGMPCLASDVYAIAMVAIQALTGMHPAMVQQGSEAGELLWQQYFPGADSHQELTAIVSRMARINPEQRYPSAIEALAAVQQLFLPPPPFPSVQAEFVQLEHRFTESPQRIEPLPRVEPTDLVPVMQTLPQDEMSPVAQLQVIDPELMQPQVMETGAGSDLKQSTGAALLVGTGIGAVLSATVCGYVTLVNPPVAAEQGGQVLQQATKQFQAGHLPQAISLAETIPNTSQSYPAAQTAIARWKKDWQTAATTYQAMVTASNNGAWLEVLNQQKNLPQITYWQEQAASLVKQATSKADSTATQLFNQAQEKAGTKNFSKAIALLKQIPEHTSTYTQAQEKLKDYSQKQATEAETLLQKAYSYAIVRDFRQALVYLEQIPEGTSVYAKAQEKIQEYTRKQVVQSKSWLVAAYQQAESKDFVGALASLEKIPQGTSLDDTVKQKTKEYTEKLYVWADYWLQKANEQANAGNFASAIASLKKIPLGTPTYSEAREKIKLYADRQTSKISAIPSTSTPSDEEMARFSYSNPEPRATSGVLPTASRIDLGSRLREAAPQI